MKDLEYYENNYGDVPYERSQIRFRKQKVREVLSRYKHDSIMEVGCGLDSIINDFDDFRSLQIIEPINLFYQNAIKDATRHINKQHINIDIEYLESWVKPVGYTSPDFILISCLLHELENVDAFLRKVNELSGNGTVIHIDVPNANSFHRLLAVEMGLIKSVYENPQLRLISSNIVILIWRN